MNDRKPEQNATKQLTLKELDHVIGGALALPRLPTVKAGGKGSINGEPVEFPIDEF